jgi:hypothetical protein
MLRVHRPSLASSRCRGERRMKDTDHYRVHPVVHSSNHRSMKEENSLETAEHTAWARRGDRLGLEGDPTVRRADAPNVIPGVAPAQADVSCGRDADAV